MAMLFGIEERTQFLAQHPNSFIPMHSASLKRTQFVTHMRPSAIQAETIQHENGTNNLKLKGNNGSGRGT